MEKLRTGNKELYKSLFTLAIPIIIQNTITNSVNMIDTVMIARLETEAVVAVSIAGKLQFIYTLVIFGFYAGSGIFISQYNGSKQDDDIRKTMTFTLLIGVFAGIVFTVFALLFPQLYMGFFTQDKLIIELGAGYLKYFALGFIPLAISFAFVIGMRSIKDSKVPMMVSLVAMFVNISFNYCLIFGKFGFPELKTEGAAIATTISRLVEMFAMIYFVYFRGRVKLRVSPKYMKIIKRDFIKEYLKVSYPVIISDALWGLGIMGYFYAYSKLGKDMFAATQMAQTVNDLTLPASFGLAFATGTLLGNKLGEDKIDEAIEYSRKIIKVAVFTGVAICFMLFLIIPVFPYIFKTTPEVIHYMTLILIVRAITNAFMPLDWTNVLGILRSGGDTIYAMVVDLVPMFIVAVPLAIGMATYWNVKGIEITDIHLVLIISTMLIEELLKLALGLPRVLQNKWAKNIIK